MRILTFFILLGCTAFWGTVMIVSAQSNEAVNSSYIRQLGKETWDNTKEIALIKKDIEHQEQDIKMLTANVDKLTATMNGVSFVGSLMTFLLTLMMVGQAISKLWSRKSQLGYFPGLGGNQQRDE